MKPALAVVATAILFLSSVPARAISLTADSPAQADVIAQIGACQITDGCDTVIIPDTNEETPTVWTMGAWDSGSTGVILSGITLKGATDAGHTIIHAALTTDSPLIQLNTGSRITGIGFTGAPALQPGRGILWFTGSGIRMDNCTIDHYDGFYVVTDDALGSIADHNTFIIGLTTSSPEVFYNYCRQYGGADPSSEGDQSWMDGPGWGGPNFFFIEDNVFRFQAGAVGAVFDGYNGSRVNFRYNNILNGFCAPHGTEPPHFGNRTFESYENIWTYSTIFDATHSPFVAMRSGSGVAWNNHGDAHYWSAWNVAVRMSEYVLDSYQNAGGITWGPNDGTSLWDKNVPGGPFASGTVTASGNPSFGTVTIAVGAPAVITLASHGLTNGTSVVFDNATSDPPIYGPYFVANATTNTFTLVAAPFGPTAVTTGGTAKIHHPYPPDSLRWIEDSSQTTWTANQFVGASLRDTTRGSMAYPIQGYSIITSNTSSTDPTHPNRIYYHASVGGPWADLSMETGFTFNVYKVDSALDQPGMGKRDAVMGQTPVYPRQQIEGVWISGNTADGHNVDAASVDHPQQMRGASSSAVTISIASPGVITWTGNGVSNDSSMILTTTGSLPTGLTPSTIYYVVNQTTNTFQLSATFGGSAINTSGSQSGVHTATAIGHWNVGLPPGYIHYVYPHPMNDGHVDRHPTTRVPPHLTGTAGVAQVLHLDDGFFDAQPDATIDRQVQRCNSDLTSCVDITGETGTTYRLVLADVGLRIQWQLTVHNGIAPDDVVTSNATGPIAGTDPNNLVSNGGFEDYAGSPDLPTLNDLVTVSWIDDSGSLAYFYPSSDSHGGNIAFGMRGSLGGRRKWQSFATTTGLNYTLKFWTKNDGGHPIGYAIKNGDENGSNIRGRANALSYAPHASYQQVVAPFAAESGLTTIIFDTNELGGAENAWLDDVEVDPPPQVTNARLFFVQ